VIDCADPGTWTLRLSTAGDHGDVATVTLRDDETTHVDLDLASWLPGQLHGVVLRNGRPLAGERVTVVVDRGVDARVFAHEQHVPTTTDAEGRFHLRLRQGMCRVQWSRRTGDGSWTLLHAAGAASVETGRECDQTFELTTGTLRVRLLDGGGKPAPCVTLQLLSTAGKPQPLAATTDKNGVAEIEADAEPFRIEVLPRRLQHPEAQGEVGRANLGNPGALAALRLRLGDVKVEQGKTTDVTLRLPADW